ncbi:MAG: hypothetical protein ACI9V1_003002 [Spirosomataceae bacterium]|jgi:hypothetical protein
MERGSMIGRMSDQFFSPNSFLMSIKQIVVLLLFIFSSLTLTFSVSAASFSKYAPKLLRFEGAGYGIHKPIYGDRDFTKSEALRIMRRNYWDRFHGDKFASQEVAEVLIDHLINAGSGRRGENIKAFEAIIGVKQDGILSVQDVERANSFYFADQIVNPYVKYRVLYYKSRREAHLYPGWITRAKSFLISSSESKPNVKDLYLPQSIEMRYKHIKL